MDLSILDDDPFIDVVVKSADGHAFKCHQVMLATTSRYMHEYFFACSTKERPIILTLPNITKCTLEYILRYIYEGEVWVARDDILAVAEASVYLEISLLQENSFMFLARAFNGFWNSNEYNTISVDNLERILTSAKLRVNSEDEKFCAVEKWLNYDLETRTQHTEKLMKCIDFNRVNVNVVNNALMANFQTFITECQNDKILFHPDRQPVSTIITFTSLHPSNPAILN